MKTHPTSWRLTAEDKALLAQLSQQYGLTQIDVLRHLMRLATQEGIHLGKEIQMPPLSTPFLLRMLFAAAAASPRATLTRTQRAAIRASLQDETWCPEAAVIPETWGRVMAWHARETERQIHKEISR